MKSNAGPGLRVILYEGKGATALDAPARNELLLSLLQKGFQVAVSRDQSSAVLAQPVEESQVFVVIGRLEDANLPARSDSRLQIRDIKGLSSTQVVALLESFRVESKARTNGGWKPWFPVIDYGRCTNCMQCLSFCLFDVYGVSQAGKIQVQNQDNCKTDCPACSRVCPEVAILFPKYRFGPVNGDEINPDDLRREAMKVDISALLGGDIYAALRDRSEKARSRFSKERDEERALKERQRCLEKLHQSLDIPAEVLASLPSVDQIQAKALEAKARAEAALARSAGV